MEARNQALLCQEIESELRELCLECRKKFPSIKEYTERAILKIRHHRDLVEQQGREAAPLLPEFPLDEVLRAILMACETFQNKIVLLSLSCLQRLIHRRVLKDETIAIVINLMKEQASNGDESVQLKVLQTIMATPSHMTLLNELVVEQLLHLLYVLHNSSCASVHHTACAGLRQLAECLADRAYASAPAPAPDDLKGILPVIRRSPAASMPTVAPAVAPPALIGPLRMFFIFVQDLCVMADYDATSLSSRYAVDAGERMRTGSREGFWLAAVKFPRPLCLELLGACVGAHPATFAATPECFALLRHNVCAVLLKNMRGCFDFAILIRSIHVLQQIFRCAALASLLMPELQVFLHLMLDLTAAERSPWQRATSLEFLRSVCEDSAALAVLYEHGGGAANVPGSQTFLELVNSLSKLVHQVCFSSGMDSLGAGAASAQRVDVGRGLRLGGMQMLVPGTDTAARGKLLQLMSETEPPVVQPSLLVALVIESVFAVVSTLYKLLLGEGEEGEEPRPQLCQGMLTDCWASLLSALSVLLHGVVDEQCLQQTLRCLQTLLYCCSRMALAQARDACLLQLTRYALPGQAEALSAKNALCFKALLHFCLGFGALLGTAGWSIALRALGGLEHRAPPGSELRLALDSLFETSAQLPPEALLDVVDAMGQGVREADEGPAALSRLVELCSVNAPRLLTVWDRVLRVATDVCMHDERGELRSAAASALCRILAKAVRKAMAEDVQQQLLQELEPLLRAPFEDARAGLCEGLLQILQAAGQELHTGAWFTMMQLVATAARLELRRSGLEFSDGAQEEEVVVADGRETVSTVLPVVFQLLELLVQDFMEYVPSGSVPQLTASIGAFARFTGLGVNSSLTAVGFLWNVADALARYHCSALEGLWLQIFMHLRGLAVDARPEVRNCAVKSLTSALLSHGRKVGTACYRTCLQEILIKVLAEVQQAAQRAREMGAGAQRAESLIVVHHSRDTPEKLWDETMVLGVEGVRRVLSHFSEEAGVSAFAPLAYVLLLQVQATLRTLTTEVSGSALRALADLMRIPASSQAFEAEDTLVSNPALPAEGTTSIWQLGWSVLWGLVRFCLGRDMPESLMEIFASTLGALRSSHRQCFTTAQHAIFTQLALVLVTAPSFYLPSQAPLQVEVSGEDIQGSGACLAGAAQACAEGGEHAEVFRFVEASPEELWNLELRTEQSQLQAYAKAAAHVGKLVDVNQSRSLDVASLEFGLSDAEALLSRGPTHRTMLHISSSRLQHAQNMAFALLEETHGLPEPGLEVLFLLQCCAVFLDVRRVLLDANKVALAVRALCLLVLFCRRLLLQHLAPSPAEPAAVAHLEALLGRALPTLCRATCTLACCCGCPQLHDSGLCKLALEGLVYLVEDSLPATERCELGAEVAAAYWEAVMGSLAEVIASALPEPGPIEAEADLLSQAVGNLLSQRLMGCAAAPPEASAHAARLLEAFVGLGGLRQPGLASLFDLCAQPGPDLGGGGLSLCAASARSGGALQLPAHCSQREALLAAAAPLLLARLRTLFEACAEEPNRHRGEVRCVLARLQALQVDAAALSALEPASARKACELAGPRAFAMALLPQLAALATVGDAAVRGGVRLVLEGLSSELGLLGGGGI